MKSLAGEPINVSTDGVRPLLVEEHFAGGVKKGTFRSLRVMCSPLQSLGWSLKSAAKSPDSETVPF